MLLHELSAAVINSFDVIKCGFSIWQYIFLRFSDDNSKIIASNQITGLKLKTYKIEALDVRANHTASSIR